MNSNHFPFILFAVFVYNVSANDGVNVDGISDKCKNTFQSESENCANGKALAPQARAQQVQVRFENFDAIVKTKARDGMEDMACKLGCLILICGNKHADNADCSGDETTKIRDALKKTQDQINGNDGPCKNDKCELDGKDITTVHSTSDGDTVSPTKDDNSYANKVFLSLLYLPLVIIAIYMI